MIRRIRNLLRDLPGVVRAMATPLDRRSDEMYPPRLRCVPTPPSECGAAYLTIFIEAKTGRPLRRPLPPGSLPKDREVFRPSRFPRVFLPKSLGTFRSSAYWQGEFTTNHTGPEGEVYPSRIVTAFLEEGFADRLRRFLDAHPNWRDDVSEDPLAV